MSKRILIPFLSAGHGLNDMMAGYLLGCLAAQQDALQAGLGLLIYNLLAFGGQYPVALWIEKTGKHKRFLSGSYGLNLAAIVLFPLLPGLSVVAAGVASAIYHVAGGSVCARQNKALHIGIFAAPGVAGLIVGGYFAWTGRHLDPILMVSVALFLLLLLLIKLPAVPINENAGSARPGVVPDRHDLIMILLLTVISLRSAAWNIFQLIHENNFTWLFAIALSACSGKILGGWLADRIGWRLYIFISLISAAPLVSFFRNEIIPFCIGIGLLQSGIPATTALMIEAVKGRTERGIGLSFGAAIIVGALVFSIPAHLFTGNGFWVLPVMAMLLLIMIIYTFLKPAVKSL